MLFWEEPPIDLSSLTSLLKSEIQRNAKKFSAELNRRCFESFQKSVAEIEAHEIEDSINELVGEMTYKEEAQ